MTVENAERPVDADAFLRRLADVLLTVERGAKVAVEVDPPSD